MEVDAKPAAHSSANSLALPSTLKQLCHLLSELGVCGWQKMTSVRFSVRFCKKNYGFLFGFTKLTAFSFFFLVQFLHCVLFNVYGTHSPTDCFPVYCFITVLTNFRAELVQWAYLLWSVAFTWTFLLCFERRFEVQVSLIVFACYKNRYIKKSLIW